MPIHTVTPKPKQFFSALDQLDQDRPVVMLNLLKYREQALYEYDEQVVSGRDAYKRYGEHVFPILEGIGATVKFGAQVAALLIAPDDEAWDDVLLVRYPSVSAFRQMMLCPEYTEATKHRTAALLDSRLIATFE